jgi:hypothetical protein
VGQIKRVEPVIAFCAVISRHADALAWARDHLESLWPGGLEEPVEVPFEAEAYYRQEMGDGVRKWMVAATTPQDPGDLAGWKLDCGERESQFARLGPGPEPRPLNLDPGYISQGKLVLATVKDRDHRIYLRDGIFAEVTLRYLRSGWTDNRWTYRDYRREETKRFADVCRKRLRQHLIAEGGFRS